MQPVSVDTNVLVRGPLEDDPDQHLLARNLMAAASQGQGLVVSTFDQVPQREGWGASPASLLEARDPGGSAGRP